MGILSHMTSNPIIGNNTVGLSYIFSSSQPQSFHLPFLRSEITYKTFLTSPIIFIHLQLHIC